MIKNEADKKYGLRRIEEIRAEIASFEKEIAFRYGLIGKLAHQISEYDDWCDNHKKFIEAIEGS